MKRSEMLLKIEEALEKTFGVDPETGERLTAPSDYLAWVMLSTAEDLGMSPPYREVFPIHTEGTGFQPPPKPMSSNSWEPEDE